MDEPGYNGHRRTGDEPSGLLPADEYSRQLEKLRGLTTHSKGQVDTRNFYGHEQTWLIETHRVPDSDGGATSDWLFLKRVGVGASGVPEALMLVLPPKVTGLIARQHAALSDKNRRKGAQQAAETRRERGIEPAFVRDPSLRGKGGKRKPRKRRTTRTRRAAV